MSNIQFIVTWTQMKVDGLLLRRYTRITCQLLGGAHLEIDGQVNKGIQTHAQKVMEIGQTEMCSVTWQQRQVMITKIQVISNCKQEISWFGTFQMTHRWKTSAQHHIFSIAQIIIFSTSTEATFTTYTRTTFQSSQQLTQDNKMVQASQ